MSRKPTLSPSSSGRDELIERRISELETRLRTVSAREVSSSGLSNTVMISQATHGFAVKDVIRHNGTSWVKSQADTAANAVVGGIVVAVLSPSVFILATSGYVDGLSGLTAGSVHYLSAATAGSLTTTAPSIAISVVLADSTTSGVIVSVGGAGGPGDGTACTVLGRSANSTGVRADIAGVANQVLTCNGTPALAFSRTITLGDASNAGSITIGNATSTTAIVLSPTLINAAGKVMSVREIDVCDAGVAKKMLVLASAPY